MDAWHRAKDLLPGTLAHDDFNNRNVGFRPGGSCWIGNWRSATPRIAIWSRC
jgi:hypothetical protein